MNVTLATRFLYISHCPRPDLAEFDLPEALNNARVPVSYLLLPTICGWTYPLKLLGKLEVVAVALPT